MTIPSKQLAQTAQRLANNDDFKVFLDITRQSALNAFENSGIDQPEIREEAHATLRVLKRIQQQLDAAVSNEVLNQHKQKGSAP